MLELVVTSEHAANGDPYSLLSCPVALALKDHPETENKEVTVGVWLSRISTISITPRAG